MLGCRLIRLDGRLGIMAGQDRVGRSTEEMLGRDIVHI